MLEEYPVFTLEAVLHTDLATHTKIFSIYDMEYYLWIKVDPTFARDYSLYELDEVDTERKYDLNIADFCYHEDNRMWFKFNSMMLNRDPGQHVYRMHFVNKLNDTTISLYFSYIVQREDATKPYKYMPEYVQKQSELMKI